MKDEVLEQLHDLTKAFNAIDMKPVICGGLGIYLKYFNREGNIELRATKDIDLMLTETQVKSETNRLAISKAIQDDSQYLVKDEAKYFKFEKPPNKMLDILVPRVGLYTKNFRVRLVKSRLHGHLTLEAKFIEEDLETVSLHNILSGDCAYDCRIQVPSAVNLLILKLFAFDDRYKKNDTERAQTHAYDIFVIAELSNREDYLQAKEFITHHAESDIISRIKSIISADFQDTSSPGWRSIPRMSIAPNLEISQRNQIIEHAARRLMRWFED